MRRDFTRSFGRNGHRRSWILSVQRWSKGTKRSEYRDDFHHCYLVLHSRQRLNNRSIEHRIRRRIRRISTNLEVLSDSFNLPERTLLVQMSSRQCSAKWTRCLHIPQCKKTVIGTFGCHDCGEFSCSPVSRPGCASRNTLGYTDAPRLGSLPVKDPNVHTRILEK